MKKRRTIPVTKAFGEGRRLRVQTIVYYENDRLKCKQITHVEY